MSLWSLSLPFALYPLTGPHWTLPFSVILSYVVLSIEDVGAEIEEPFHVLPLRQYTEGKYTQKLSKSRTTMILASKHTHHFSLFRHISRSNCGLPGCDRKVLRDLSHRRVKFMIQEK